MRLQVTSITRRRNAIPLSASRIALLPDMGAADRDGLINSVVIESPLSHE